MVGPLSGIPVTYEQHADVHNVRHTFSAGKPEYQKQRKDTSLANDLWTFVRFDRFDIPGVS